MLERNPDARCGNCPYFFSATHPVGLGSCRRHPDERFKFDCQWCGEHPDSLREVGDE